MRIVGWIFIVTRTFADLFKTVLFVKRDRFGVFASHFEHQCVNAEIFCPLLTRNKQSRGNSLSPVRGKDRHAIDENGVNEIAEFSVSRDDAVFLRNGNEIHRIFKR